jgi:nicotinamidase-related amidase
MANPPYDPDRDLLLLIDVQHDFCPVGALAVSGGDEIVPTVNRLAEPVPEPATNAIIVGGLAALGVWRRRQRHG